MPRKIKRHWGEDGEYTGEHFDPTASEIEELFALLGIGADDEQHQYLLENLNYIGQYFRKRHGQRSEKFSRAEARAEIEDLRQSKAFDYFSLSKLNARAHDHLFFALIETTKGHKLTREFMSIDLMDDLIADQDIEEALELASENLKAIKGPGKEPDLYIAVARLCKLYMDLTGKLVTHSNKGERLAYSEESQSHAGQFVTACFALIDSNIRPAQISRAMRNTLKFPIKRWGTYSSEQILS